MVIALLLAVFLCLAASVSGHDNENLKPCDVSILRESILFVLGRNGIAWVDGNQTSLDALNQEIDRLLKSSEQQNRTLRWNSAKLFYTAKYSHLIVAGIQVNATKFLMGLLDVNQTLGASGFLPINQVIPDVEKICFWKVSEREWPGNFHDVVEGGDTKDNPVVCDLKTMVFDPRANNFTFDGDKKFTLRLLEEPDDNGRTFRLDYMDKFFKDRDNCARCSKYLAGSVPHELIADFHSNAVPPAEGFGRFFLDPRNTTQEDEDFFYNQLETGNFKLRAELFDNNGVKYYYHVLTRLNGTNLYSELEKCYIRKFVKTKVKKEDIDDKDKQPLEYPRMLIIPKENRTDGVFFAPTTTTPEPTTDFNMGLESDTEWTDDAPRSFVQMPPESPVVINEGNPISSLLTALIMLFVNSLIIR